MAVAVGTGLAHERVWASDVARITGDLRLARDPTASADAERTYNEAISIARGNSAKSLELRAALRLACLQIRQGRRHEAKELLRPIYAWFTEGLDTADLKEARELLEQAA